MQKLKALLITGIVWFVWVYSVYHARASNNTIDVDLEKNTDTTKDCQETRKQLVLPSWWKLNDQCRSQKYVPILPVPWMDRDERIINLFLWFWYTFEEWKELWDVYRSAWRIGRIRWEFLVCIAYADSSLGKSLLTKNNPGNIWNNDRWDKQWFDSIERWVYAIAQTLNNKYLWNKSTLIELSLHEMNKAWRPVDKFYASWKNRAMNVSNCLGLVHNKDVSLDFNYRF